MIKSLFIILTLGGVSIYYSDLDSDSLLSSTLLPLTVVASLVALTLWLVVLFHRRGIDQSASPGGDGGNGFFCGDGDGGD